MSRIKTKNYHLDDDILQSVLRFDPAFGLWFEDYIDFEAEPRYTPNGRRWRSATDIGCPYSDPQFKDCGTCPMLRKQHPKDLIGVCYHEALRKENLPAGMTE